MTVLVVIVFLMTTLRISGNGVVTPVSSIREHGLMTGETGECSVLSRVVKSALIGWRQRGRRRPSVIRRWQDRSSGRRSMIRSRFIALELRVPPMSLVANVSLLVSHI
jgi:hypothetical protein